MDWFTHFQLSYPILGKYPNSTKMEENYYNFENLYKANPNEWKGLLERNSHGFETMPHAMAYICVDLFYQKFNGNTNNNVIICPYTNLLFKLFYSNYLDERLVYGGKVISYFHI